MTKEEHIKHWVDSSTENWNTAEYLLDGKQYVMTLFMFHLSIEKLLKAHWIKANVGDSPPRTHDLQFLFSETELDLNGETYDLLGAMNSWNISTRYPDYKTKLHQICTTEYMQRQFERVKNLRASLLKRL